MIIETLPQDNWSLRRLWRLQIFKELFHVEALHMGNLGDCVTEPRVHNPEDENVWEETPRKSVEFINRYPYLEHNASKNSKNNLCFLLHSLCATYANSFLISRMWGNISILEVRTEAQKDEESCSKIISNTGLFYFKIWSCLQNFYLHFLDAEKIKIFITVRKTNNY